MTRKRAWRGGAASLLAAIFVAAVGSVVLDGGRAALAADDCQYGQYGPYGACKTKPTLRVLGPSTTQIGFSFVPQAVLELGDSPTGSLTFRVFRPADTTCASAAYTSSVNVNGNGFYQYPPFAPFPLLDLIGRWRVTAVYGGDARNEPVATSCGAFAIDVTKRQSSVFLNQVFSARVGESATVTGSAFLFQPTEQIVLRAYGPGDPSCSGLPRFERRVAASFFTEPIGPFDVAGTWRLVASYPGDASNLPFTSLCSSYSLEVAKAFASLEPVAMPGTTLVGQPLQVGARVLGFAPTGSLTIRLYGPSDPGCFSPVDVIDATVTGSGSSTAAFAPTSVGTWRFTVQYSGDVSNTSALSYCGARVFTAEKATPAVSVAAAPVLAEPDDTLGATAVVRDGFRPTGTVELQLFGPGDPTCSGVPRYVEQVELRGSTARTAVGFQVPKRQLGTWNWAATYLGDESNVVAESGCGQAAVEVVKKRR
jgi:hypothetical protein